MAEPDTCVVSVVQTSPQDDDKPGTLARMAELLDEAGRRGSDFVVLPEVWTGTGFSRDGAHAELAEPIPGPATAMLSEKARRHGMHIVGSLYERAPDGRIHNSAPVIAPSGETLAVYRKTHLFDASSRPDLPSVLDESRKVAPGRNWWCATPTAGASASPSAPTSASPRSSATTRWRGRAWC